MKLTRHHHTHDQVLEISVPEVVELLNERRLETKNVVEVNEFAESEEELGERELTSHLTIVLIKETGERWEPR